MLGAHVGLDHRRIGRDLRVRPFGQDRASLKQGLAAARAQGKQLGRPKGSRNQDRTLEPFLDDIKKYLKIGLKLTEVRKIINPQLEEPISYQSYRYFVLEEPELAAAWQRPSNTYN
jgi:hypothetical protein